jgi:D-methionine transport system ATP-binding protein
MDAGLLARSAAGPGLPSAVAPSSAVAGPRAPMRERADAPAPSGAGSIAFRGVEKTFEQASGRVGALRGIDVDIPAGGVFGVIGRSGAGKSTLLRLINRLETPTAGSVLVGGVDVGRLDVNGLVALRRRVGMIFQHFNLLSAKTAAENVARPLVAAKRPRAEIEARVAEVLALVGLEDKRDVRPGRLSGGQKQRVGIARALAGRPEILLCDEATSALDPETTQSILRLLKDINRRLGITIVLVTHEMRVIREACDRVLVLDRGETAETGPVWQVFGDPQHAATRTLLQPLTRGLPDDLATRVRPGRPSAGPAEALVELAFAGDAEPDLATIAARLGGRPRILSAALDRIDGHTQGRLLVALPLAPGATPDLSGLAHSAKVLGYVAADD